MKQLSSKNLFYLLLTFALLVEQQAGAAGAKPPNIIFILADDLGWGDVQCYQPSNRIRTPNLDQLAAGGLRFTDAHTPSSVCTPTRYGLLTGRYAWRSRLQKGVLYGFSPPLIAPNQPTLAGLLRARGYHTSAIGKWHLGLDWQMKEPGTMRSDSQERQGDGWKIDYSRPILNGPLSVGFNHFFGISASLDMPPYVFIENDRVRSVPEVEKQWIRSGPAARDFEAIDVLPSLAGQTVSQIEKAAASSKSGKPFFIYLALASPHTPILPTDSWRGKSGLTPYADFVMETDALVGTINTTLNRLGLAENTLLIFTSDNGCSPAAGIPLLQKLGHHPSGPWRGHKADLFEGGHRVPLIVQWPARIQPGRVSTRLVCHTDWFATFADLTGSPPARTEAPDSFSFADEFNLSRKGPRRDGIVHHSIDGSFSYREGDWKLLLAPGSGGWSSPRPGTKEEAGLPTSQLYHLKNDPSEQNNQAATRSGRATQMTRTLGRIVEGGFSRKGAVGTNELPVAWNRFSTASPRP